MTTALTLQPGSTKSGTLMILPSGRNRTGEAMPDKLAQRQAAPLMQSELLSPKQQIIVALGMMAIMRNGEYAQETLETFAAGLLKEPLEDVLRTIQGLADRPRGAHEAACPDFG